MIQPLPTLDTGVQSATSPHMERDHNAGYRWHDIETEGQFSLERNELGTLRVVRHIQPDNADAMRGVEIMAEGQGVQDLANVLARKTPQDAAH